MLAKLHLRVSLAILITFCLVNSSQAASATTSTQRFIVKLQPNVATEVENFLPSSTMTIVNGQQMGALTQALMGRHSVRQLSPLYRDIVQAKKRGYSAAQIANAVRQRYPARAQRFHGLFQPPDISRTYVLEINASGGLSLTQILSSLQHDPSIEYAEPDHIDSTNLTPNDPYFSSYGTWGQSYPDLWGIQKIGSSSAWDTSTGAGVVVAVVDTGIDYNHPDLAANVWMNTKEIAGNGIDDDGNGYVDDVLGWDFIGSTYQNPTQGNNPIDHFGHGTHVAGTIAAVGNNGIGVIGVAFQAHVMAVKGLDDSGYGLDSTLGPAIIYAANNGAEVISNSWAGQGSSQTIADAVSYAYSLGAVIVAAAGNNSDDARKYYPANLPQVITVAATDHNDYTAYFSNWGSKIDVAAPGVDILSLRAAGTSMGTPVDAYYTRADGTSMATPHVSGLAALLLSGNPQYSNEDVRQAIRTSANDLSTPGFDLDYGYGRINASAAVGVGNVLEAKILSPTDGTHIKSTTTISGVARGNGFSQYVLEYGAGHLPTSWTLIQSGTMPVAGSALGTFDPSTVPDGVYAIRLTAYDTSNHAFVDRIELVVDEVSISAPPPPIVPSTASVFKPGVTVSISGTATGPSFLDFRIDWAEGINPSSGWTNSGITLTSGGLSPISSGTLGNWDTTSITQGDFYTIRLSVDNNGFTSVATTLVYLEPSLLSSGWPQWLDQAPYFSSGVVPAMDSSGAWHLTLQNPGYGNTTLPAQFWNFSADGLSNTITQVSWGNLFTPAAGDLDGVPGDEVVAGEANSLRYFNLNNTSSSFLPGISANFQWSQVVQEDLDGDSQLETIALGTDYQTQTAHVFAWRRDGTQLNTNFPLTVQDLNSNLHYPSGPRVLVGDIDGDGQRELVVQEGTSASTFALRLFANDGSPKPWSAPVFNGYSDQMVLADLDHNGTLNVILLCLCNSQKELHVLQPDGTERPGWPLVLGSTSWSYLAVGDLNRDGREEIVVSNYATIYVLEPDGTSFSPAWPMVGSAFATLGAVALADVDGDGLPEILVSRDQLLTASNPLLQSVSPAVATAGGQITVSRTLSLNGTLTLQQNTARTAQAYSPNWYFQPQLIALHSDGSIVRSWNLLGANGNQPTNNARLTVGDFNQDGLTDIAAVYFDITGGGISGYLNEGVMTVLTTGAPYNPAANDWPMIYQNPRNTAVLIRDHTPPTITITSPAAGSGVMGVVTLAASASDNVGVTKVQFQVDGNNFGLPLTTAPFHLSWDTSGAALGTHTLSATAWDAAGNSATSQPITVTVLARTASIAPSSLSFGSQVLSATSPSQAVTLSNTGNAAVDISGIQISGDFSQTNNCSASLGVGANCSINVSFTPTAMGSRTGTLTITSDANGGNPMTATLAGTGANNAPTFSPTSIAFGSVYVGKASGNKTVKLTANGPLALALSGISVSPGFTQTNNCPGSLNKGSSCNITVAFVPSAAGPASGTLSVADNGVGSPQVIPLTGTGLDFVVKVAPSSASVTAGGKATYTVTVSALGGSYSNNVALSCSTLPKASKCSFSPSGISPGSTSANSTLTVSTTSGATGTPAGSYTITVIGSANNTTHSATTTLIVQ